MWTQRDLHTSMDALLEMKQHFTLRHAEDHNVAFLHDDALRTKLQTVDCCRWALIQYVPTESKDATLLVARLELEELHHRSVESLGV